MPFLCGSAPCLSVPAEPSPRVALPRFALASPCFVVLRPGLSTRCRSMPLQVESLLCRRVTDLCAALAVRCMSLPLPVIAALWFAFAPVRMSWPCRRTSSPRPSLPPPRGAMLFFSSAVLSVRGPAHLCPASASRSFCLPCLRSVVLGRALPPLGAARPHRSMPRLSCVPFSGAPRDPLSRSRRSVPTGICLCRCSSSTRAP